MAFYGDEYKLEQMTREELQIEYEKRLKEFREARSKLITICQIKEGNGESTLVPVSPSLVYKEK